MRLARVINNSTALLALDLLTKALPLVVFPFLVRALGPQTYGKLGFATAIAGFFGLLASPGFSSYALREAARNPESVPLLVQHVTGARVAFAFCSYCLLLIFTFAGSPGDGMTKAMILLAGLTFVVGSFDAQWVFASRSRMWMIAARGALAQCIYAALILTLIRHQSDAWKVPLSGLISAMAGAMLIWLAARREYHIPWPRLQPRAWAGFLRVCLTLGLASMMSLIYDQIDTVMLKYTRSDAELGLYVASYRLMTVAMSFVPILGQVFFPLLSENAQQNEEQEKRYLRWFGYASIGLALPIATGGFLLAAPITRLILGPQYTGADVLLRWLMLTILAGPLASYFGSQLVPNGREGKYLKAVAVGAALNVGLNLIFLPKYGAIAAAITTAISQGVVAALNYYYVRDLPRPDLTGPVVVSVVATGFMAVTVSWLHASFNIHVLVLIALGAAVYAMAYFLARAARNRLLALGRSLH